MVDARIRRYETVMRSEVSDARVPDVETNPACGSTLQADANLHDIASRDRARELHRTAGTHDNGRLVGGSNDLDRDERARRVMRRLRGVSIVCAMTFAAACTNGTTTPSGPALPSPTTQVPATPTAAASTVRPTPVAVSYPRGTAQLPTMRPLPQYAATSLTLAVDHALGQPSEYVVWTVKPFQPDSGYASRVASTLGLQGPGTLGDAPGNSAPWRLWLGSKTLAVNERTGAVLFFDPTAEDGPRPAGAAQPDPAEAFARLLGSLGTSIDLTLTPRGDPAFRGTDALSIAEPVMDGSWLGAGNRDGVVLFANAPNPYDPIYQPGTTVYDADELGLFTPKGRPVQIVHHPFGTLSGGAIYSITTYGQAAAELRAQPNRYLRLLSAPLGEPMTLHVTPRGANHGSAWAGGTSDDLTRSRRTLVPVWEFLAEGTTASGKPVTAVFLVDAVLPEFRAPPASFALALNADILLRTQLAVSVGGHQPWRMSLAETAKDALPGFALGPSAQMTIAMTDADTAQVRASDGQRAISLVFRHAFPGLANSIWYLSGSSK